MKILLLSDVDSLGWLGDVLEVKDGYARNYLLPQGLATIPTEANIKSIAKEKEERAKQRIEEAKRMAKAAEEVNGAEAVIASKCNSQGHLFGSVTEADIAGNLREQGFEVADGVVKLSEHIKEVGTYENVALRFSPDIKVHVTVVVVPTEDSDYVAPEPVAVEEPAEDVQAEVSEPAEESADQEEKQES